MAIASEVATSKTQLAAGIAAGVNTLSLDQQITFNQYVRVVLPLDGFVFWVLNASATPLVVNGSLHYSTATQQNEDETPAVNQVIFTALSQVQDLNEIASSVLYVSSYQGMLVAFSQRSPFYQQADTYHYVGTAILPAMQNQFITSAEQLNGELIVSNSLPIWLSLNNYVPPYPGFSNNVTLYPSYAVPSNIVPPYASVHIEPGDTDVIQAIPFYDRSMTPWQLMQDTVRITTYGLDNSNVMNLRDCILQYSTDYETLGLMEGPAIRDEKRPQSEAQILAQKKTISLTVSYNQSTARHIARQLIERVIADYLPNDLGFNTLTQAPGGFIFNNPTTSGWALMGMI
jgi:hypothetical protein